MESRDRVVRDWVRVEEQPWICWWWYSSGGDVWDWRLGEKSEEVTGKAQRWRFHSIKRYASDVPIGVLSVTWKCAGAGWCLAFTNVIQHFLALVVKRLVSALYQKSPRQILCGFILRADWFFGDSKQLGEQWPNNQLLTSSQLTETLLPRLSPQIRYSKKPNPNKGAWYPQCKRPQCLPSQCSVQPFGQSPNILGPKPSRPPESNFPLGVYVGTHSKLRITVINNACVCLLDQRLHQRHNREVPSALLIHTQLNIMSRQKAVKQSKGRWRHFGASGSQGHRWALKRLGIEE